ncbi:hypothetical protein DFS34DRAFT_621173 [Phlyctochytrium arcticum]|nr:hypothetical protein DFS34DRAFT_621173 [Phlyctochytrium arcticum]
MTSFYDEVEIEDMDFDADTQTYTYPCPCGDKFEITQVYSRACAHHFRLLIRLMFALRIGRN